MPGTIRMSLVFLALCVVGSCDHEAALASSAAALDAWQRGGFDPAYQPRPVDCEARGLQFIAHRADDGGWQYACVDAFLSPDHVRR